MKLSVAPVRGSLTTAGLREPPESEKEHEMTRPIVSLSDSAGFPNGPEGSDRFGATVAPVSNRIGLGKIGCMYLTVEPGKRAFPFHNHLGNDEMFVILEGQGTYRFGNAEYEVRAGDVCGAPRGGPETAHQLINTGDTTLRYLGISSSHDPDVVEYPDSEKFAAVAIFPGADFMNAHLKFVGRMSSQVGYFDGEDV